MRLIKARVRGFQSFSDSGEVTFSEGINLIIGQNNAGKVRSFALCCQRSPMTAIGRQRNGTRPDCCNRRLI